MGDEPPAVARNNYVLRFNATKPYRLEKKSLSHDEVENWWYTVMTYLRQDLRFLQFMTGGTLSTWSALCDDETRGITVAPIVNEGANEEAIAAAAETARVATDTRRNDLEDFLNAIASFSPGGLFYPIRHEAISTKWILDMIKNLSLIHI